MKTLLYFLLLIALSAYHGACQEKDKYSTNLEIARSLYHKHEFLKSAQFYSKAFQANNNLGRADHRFEAARAWALAGNSDSAFYQLERSVKGNYSEYFRLSTDTAFYNFRDDNRWNKIINSVKLNESKSDSLSNDQYPNMNHQLAATLDTIRNDDQLLRWEEPIIEKSMAGTHLR